MEALRLRRLPRPLFVFLTSIIVFTGLSVAKMLRLRLISGSFRELEPLAPPGPFFDFYCFMSRIHFVHHAEFFTAGRYPWMYPAPAAPLYALLYSFCVGGNWFWGWLVLALATVGGCLFAITRMVRFRPAKGIFPFYLCALVLSWPIYLSLQRGNIESLLWLVLAAGIWQFMRGKWTAAAVLIGLAGAFKVYPILCLALFLPKLKWRQGVLGVFVMVATTVGSLWFINPDLRFAFRHISEGVQQFTFMYGSSVEVSQGVFDHSAFELLKYVVRPQSALVMYLMHRYFVVAACVMLLVYFLRVVRLPLTNQVLFLVTAGVFLPPASFDYTLQSLYIPFAVVVLAMLGTEQREGWESYALMVLFAAEFAPLTFIQREGCTANGVVKAVGLLALLAIAASKPLPSPIEAPNWFVLRGRN